MSFIKILDEDGFDVIVHMDQIKQVELDPDTLLTRVYLDRGEDTYSIIVSESTVEEIWLKIKAKT